MFYCKQCEGCAYNTMKYAEGCECFTELPWGCRNYTVEEGKRKRERQMKYYKERTEAPLKLKYVHVSGGAGKYMLTKA
jgi:hypothetical protein